MEEKEYSLYYLIEDYTNLARLRFAAHVEDSYSLKRWKSSLNTCLLNLDKLHSSIDSLSEEKKLRRECSWFLLHIAARKVVATYISLSNGLLIDSFIHLRYICEATLRAVELSICEESWLKFTKLVEEPEDTKFRLPSIGEATSSIIGLLDTSFHTLFSEHLKLINDLSNRWMHPTLTSMRLSLDFYSSFPGLLVPKATDRRNLRKLVAYIDMVSNIAKSLLNPKSPLGSKMV